MIKNKSTDFRAFLMRFKVYPAKRNCLIAKKAVTPPTENAKSKNGGEA